MEQNKHVYMKLKSITKYRKVGLEALIGNKMAQYKCGVCDLLYQICHKS